MRRARHVEGTGDKRNTYLGFGGKLEGKLELGTLG
jgi:hypothetical protein